MHDAFVREGTVVWVGSDTAIDKQGAGRGRGGRYVHTLALSKQTDLSGRPGASVVVIVCAPSPGLTKESELNLPYSAAPRT